MNNGEQKKDKKRDKFSHLLFENKRIIFTIEICILVVSVIILVIGRIYGWNEILLSLTSSVFTACLITIVVSLINWNVHNEYEATLKAVKDEAEGRVKDAINMQTKLEKAIESSCENCKATVAEMKGTSQNSCKEIENIVYKLNDVLNTFFNRSCIFCKTYMIDVYQNRTDSNLASFFAKAKSKIFILTTNLDSIKHCTNVLRSQAKKGIDVRLCTINPIAAKEFNITRVTGGNANPENRFNSMKNSLLHFIETNEALFDNTITNKTDEPHDKENSMQIKTYSIMPTMIMFISDDECIVSFMLNKYFARDVMHIHFNMNPSHSQNGGGDITPKIFEDHFISIFNDATYVSQTTVSEWSFIV
jgi:hypothetical protein